MMIDIRGARSTTPLYLAYDWKEQGKARGVSLFRPRVRDDSYPLLARGVHRHKMEALKGGHIGSKLYRGQE